MMTFVMERKFLFTAVGPPELARVHAHGFVGNRTGASPARPSACLPFGESGMASYDSALDFLPLVFRIHGVQPDAPAGHRFRRAVAGPQSIGPGGATWVAGSKAEGLVGRHGGFPSTPAHAKVHSSGPEG